MNLDPGAIGMVWRGWLKSSSTTALDPRFPLHVIAGIDLLCPRIPRYTSIWIKVVT